MKLHLASPCLSCTLGESDKNNPTCQQCAKRVAYVAFLDRELDYPAGRPDSGAAARGLRSSLRLLLRTRAAELIEC